MEDEYIKKFEDLKVRMYKYIDELAFSYKWHMRIITDVEFKFPKNYEMVGHDDLIEVSHIPWDKHEKGGWSKPDLQFGDVEIRYLWKQFRPKFV